MSPLNLEQREVINDFMRKIIIGFVDKDGLEYEYSPVFVALALHVLLVEVLSSNKRSQF